MSKELQKAEQEKAKGKDLSDLQMKEIEGLYMESIEIPTTKNRTKILLCPVGLVGAGKTTVIEPICKELNLVRVSTDEIRKILQEKGFNFIRTVETALRIVKYFLGEGYSVAIDADCISPKAQDCIQKVQKEYNAVPIWIHIKPPEKFIINKLKNYDHDWLFRDADHAISDYKRRKPLHKEHLKDIDFYFKFDSSKDDLDEQINKFLDKIKRDITI